LNSINNIAFEKRSWYEFNWNQANAKVCCCYDNRNIYIEIL